MISNRAGHSASSRPFRSASSEIFIPSFERILTAVITRAATTEEVPSPHTRAKLPQQQDLPVQIQPAHLSTAKSISTNNLKLPSTMGVFLFVRKYFSCFADNKRNNGYCRNNAPLLRIERHGTEKLCQRSYNHNRRLKSTANRNGDIHCLV